MNMPNRILVRALELIELGWTQRALARDENGNQVGVADPGACSWCSAGARNKAARELRPSNDEEFEARRALSDAMGTSAPAFNDSHTKAEVVAAFKAAIQATAEAPK